MESQVRLEPPRRRSRRCSTQPYTTIRKVEIHDVYDLDRWWWKATDGIRETTWPGVYNRSRLIGRDDYFELPDWDCYSLSGKAITFYMPDEPWNHLEIAGGAWGTMEPSRPRQGKSTDSETHALRAPQGPGDHLPSIRRAHHRPKNPLHQRRAGTAHRRALRLLRPSRHGAHRRRHAALQAHQQNQRPTTIPPPSRSSDYIAGRFPADERMTMMAMPAGAPGTRAQRHAIRPAHRPHPHPRRLPLADGRRRPRLLLRLGEHGRRPRRHRHRSARRSRSSPTPTA